MDLHQDKKLSIVPLDVGPEGRTKRCSPRFRPGVRFRAKFQIPVARQWGREMSAPRPFSSTRIDSYYETIPIYVQPCIRYFFHMVRKNVGLTNHLG